MPSLRVAALEMPHRYGDVAVALRDLDVALAALSGDAELCLLPECALTGYLSPDGDFDLTRFAEGMSGPTAHALADAARRHGIALAGPLVERDGDRLYNALLLYDARGMLVGHWRKRHPWYPERWASAGDLGTPVITLGGVRLTACICFDIHFIADDAPDALAASDALLFPSAWVEDRVGEDHRRELLGGLARRFGITVINANWGVGVPRVWGQGGSRIATPEGAVSRLGGGARSAVLHTLHTATGD